jgi:hypothetical protein
MFLFVQQWEIIRGKGAEYTDFVLRRHLPVMTKVGLNTIGGFHVIVGSGPRISSVSLADDFLNLQRAVESEDFVEVTKELHEFVYNYSNAVLKGTGRVNMEGYGIEVGTWRFNQYFKLIHGTEVEYTQFLQNEYIPVLTKLGIRVKAEWQVILGTGLRILLEGVTTSLVDIGKAIMSDEFRSLRRQLLSSFAGNYSSRILAPTGRVEIAYLLGEMTKAL